MSETKLTDPQVRALSAAKDGRLMWARPVMSGGGYFISQNDWRTSGVRSSTVDALIKRRLLVQPRGRVGDWSTMPVQITGAGLNVLAEVAS